MKNDKDLWWYSNCRSRGFCWGAVVGHDYRKGAQGGISALYLYLNGGIFHSTGPEADSLFELIKQRGIK